MTQIITPNGFAPDPWQGTDIPPLSDYAGGETLLIAPDTELSTLEPLLPSLRLIVIPFASNTDGRGFSLARQLRMAGYRGHLRARGHLLVDQLRAALRCGFDDLEISADHARRMPEAQWRAVPMAQGYQSHLFAKEPA